MDEILDLIESVLGVFLSTLLYLKTLRYILESDDFSKKTSCFSKFIIF